MIIPGGLIKKLITEPTCLSATALSEHDETEKKPKLNGKHCEKEIKIVKLAGAWPGEWVENVARGYVGPRGI